MKKGKMVVIIVLTLIALGAFCNYPNERKIAKDSTEIATIQSDTTDICVEPVIEMMNGDLVSEDWLRYKLKFHDIKDDHIEVFVIIAKKESSLNPNVINTTLNRDKSIDTGLFQINSIHKHLYEKYDLLDPEQNLLAALELYEESKFRPWRFSIGDDALQY